MALFRRKKRDNTPQSAPPGKTTMPDLSEVSDEDFWGAAQEYLSEGEDEPVFGENLVETFSRDDLITAEAADSARFRLNNPGYLESQVDDFVADVVDALKYYEQLVLMLHKENEALNDHVNSLQNTIEVFRVQGRVMMDDDTAKAIKTNPRDTNPSGKPSQPLIVDDDDDSPFGSDDGDDFDFPAAASIEDEGDAINW